ncbi:MAG: hypothetical protein ACR2NR_23585 [Solirubrobacteraceae bacterium]
MAQDPPGSSPTRVQPFFTTLLHRDAAGGSWLPALLRASPYGEARLGDLIDAPGWLQTQLAVRTASGLLGCFQYPAPPPRELLAWFIEHPEELVWPPGAQMSADMGRLRRALIDDDPPGSRPRAQERARELLRKRSALSREWWRFEEMTQLDCVLITERLVIAVEGNRTGRLEPATEWYPQRSRLAHDLEAAKRLADGKRWFSLILTEELLPDADDAHVERTLVAATPHLDPAQQRELRDGYLGNLTWEAAFAAVGIPWGSLPQTIADLDAVSK